METNTWKIEKDLCRCCHTEGSFKNLAEPCTEMGEEEIYCDMLRDSFDIDLTPVPGNLCAPTFTICEPCILRLRDASTFKKQVMQCEKKFREMYSKNVIIASAPAYVISVKEEPEVTDALIKYELEKHVQDVDSGSDDDKLSVGVKYSDMEDGDDDDEDDYPLLKATLLKDVSSKKKGNTSNKRKATKSSAKTKPQKKLKEKKEKIEEESKDAEDEDKKVKKRGANLVVRKFPVSKEDWKEEGDKFVCTKCNKRYSRMNYLSKHLSEAHYDYPRYECPCCKELFMTAVILLEHKLNEHGIDERFKCQACDKAFFRKRNFDRHMLGYHKLGQLYKCDICDYVAYNPGAIKKHSFNHTTEKNFHCRFCKKSFKRKTTLTLHEKIHTGDKNKVCTECGKAFVQKASLNYHMTKYHPEVRF